MFNSLILYYNMYISSIILHEVIHVLINYVTIYLLDKVYCLLWDSNPNHLISCKTCQHYIHHKDFLHTCNIKLSYLGDLDAFDLCN